MFQATAPQDELRHIAERLEGRSAQDILRWTMERYGDSIVLACSFGGPTGMVLLDMVMAIAPRTPVFYLDTGLLFPQTYALVQQAAQRYGITPLAVQSDLSVAQQTVAHGESLWARDPDQCCAIRKVAPQRQFLQGYDAWITGLRRDQADTRRSTPVVSWDAKFGLAKIAPLATWSEEEVWTYLYLHDVPYNPLHEQGYPSLGCTHCTRPVLPGEHARAGRWSGHLKTECGLHLQPERSASL